MAETRAISPAEAVDALLSIERDEALEAALAETDPITAARAVSAAPTLRQKTTLLWAMEDRRRREVLELVPPPVIGALVQNLEEDNRYLLGDLSLEQFRSLLALCSAERKFYWVVTALSFTDVRANALPLLLPDRELVEILMTRAAFQEHVRALAEYPLEEQRIPPDMLADPAQGLVDFLGPENLLRLFPITDPALESIVRTVLEYDPDRYADLIREGLRLADYAENHPEEWQALTEAPVLLESLDPVEVVVRDVPLSPEAATPAPEGPPLALVPTGASPLARMAAALPQEQVRRVADELQHLYIRQAVAEGGSFLQSDLERVARQVEAYLLLGLRAESGGNAEAEAAVLAQRPLHKVSQSGAKGVERLRQVALRLGPLERVLDPEQRAVVRSLSRPRLTVGPEGEPRLLLLPGGSLPEDVDLDMAGVLLRDVAAWVALARALGVERTEAAVKAAGGVARLQEELVLAAVLYGRLEPGLIEPADRKRFQARYVRRGSATAEARAGIRRAVQVLAQSRLGEPDVLLPLLDSILDRAAAETENR